MITNSRSGGTWFKALRSRISPRHRFLASMTLAIFRTSGVFAAADFGRATMDVHKCLDDRYGPTLHNLVLCFAGLWSGCRFCGVNHLYTANLEYFQKTGKVLPVAETEVMDLQQMPYDKLMDLVRERFSGPEFADELRTIARLFEIYTGASVETDEDHLLSRSIDVWKWVNECTIPLSYDMQFEDIPPMFDRDPPEGLLQRYHEARAASQKPHRGP